MGALIGLIATAQPWWMIRHGAGSTPLSGTVTSGGLSQSLPAVLVAGWLLALTLRARGRRVLGVLLGLVGIAMTVLGVRGAPPAEALVQSTVQLAALGGARQLTRAAGGAVYAGAGVVAVAGAVLLVLRASRWPERARRFEQGSDPGGPPRPTRTATHDPATADPATADPATVWRILDEGADPTARAVDQPASAATTQPTGAGSPISPPTPDAATMGGTPTSAGPELERDTPP